MRNRDAINDKLYNMNLITVDKFTVQGRISNNMHRIFKAENVTEKRPTKEFAKSLTLAIEESLMESGLSEEQSKVADLTFSFDNGNMINLLQYRAKAIHNAKFDIVSKIENKMTRLKNQDFEKLNVPNTFYCTFANVAARKSALNLERIDFYGERLKVKEALNPSDIIWENREVTGFNRSCRLIVTVIFFLFILWCFFNFGANTLYSSLTIKYWQNPPGVDCQTVIKNYGSDLP